MIGIGNVTEIFLPTQILEIELRRIGQEKLITGGINHELRHRQASYTLSERSRGAPDNAGMYVPYDIPLHDWRTPGWAGPIDMQVDGFRGEVKWVVA